MSWGKNVHQTIRGSIFVSFLIVACLTLGAAGSASAQQSSSGSSDGSGFSVAAGMGFFAEDNFDGFLLNFEGSYHLDEHWSAGVDFQLGFANDALLFSMPFFGQYDFGNFPVDVPVLQDMHAFVKTGMGFTYAEVDLPGRRNVDDTGFLFVLGGGVAYPVTDNISLESRMQFNITTNRFFEDDFYFSWEVIGARFRF